LKTKELLSSWGIAFEAVNVESDPSASKVLERLGISLVPVLVQGDRVFQGWDPKGLARFLGAEYTDAAVFSPQELAGRLDRILEAAQHVLSQVPPERLTMKTPNCDRTVRDLAYHVFRLSLAYRDSAETRNYPAAWLQETPPVEMADGSTIAEYGQRVRERLADWWKRPDAYEGAVHTYYGIQTAHELLERTVWHAAQHLRQLYTLLKDMGVTPQDPLNEADFQGLPQPKELW